MSVPENRTRDIGDVGSREGCGGVHDIVDVTPIRAYMLKIVDVTGDVHVHPVTAKHRIESGLQVSPFLFIL